MAELPQEMSNFVLPSHCNGTSENSNVTYQLLSASAHTNRTYCTQLKAKRSASLSKLFDAVLLLAICWDLEGGSFNRKGKGRLRQREPQFMQNQADHTIFPSFSSKTVIRTFLQ
jgi:hypothetical protein